MPCSDWTCHACQAQNGAGSKRCVKCGRPAEAAGKETRISVEAGQAGTSGQSIAQQEPKLEPITPVLFVLFGLFLLGGAIYQVANGKWFPLFPVQIDAFFAVFDWSFGLNAGIYASSLVAAALGSFISWLGIAGLAKGCRK